MKVDLGSRGGCRVLITPENLDIISTGRVSGIHASECTVAAGLIPSFLFVNVDWTGTSRICFRIQRCALSDGSEFCGGAVHRTLEPEAPLVLLTKSVTPEFLARRWVEHSFGAADRVIHVAVVWLSSSWHLVLSIVRDWTSGRVLAILVLWHQGAMVEPTPLRDGERRFSNSLAD